MIKSFSPISHEEDMDAFIYIKKIVCDVDHNLIMMLKPSFNLFHAEQILKKPLKTSNPRPNFSLGAGNRLLSFYCTRASAG
jgi:hypothetical protein